MQTKSGKSKKPTKTGMSNKTAKSAKFVRRICQVNITHGVNEVSQVK